MVLYSLGGNAFGYRHLTAYCRKMVGRKQKQATRFSFSGYSGNRLHVSKRSFGKFG